MPPNPTLCRGLHFRLHLLRRWAGRWGALPQRLEVLVSEASDLIHGSQVSNP